MSAITLTGLSKRFGDVAAVDGVDLEVRSGEFLTLLGPSGSGKTTVLRMIAGFEVPTSGRILLDGQDVTDMPANRRDVNTVFQDYALFPHMSVQQNVEYGLKVKKVGKDERRHQAADALESVALAGFGDRMPSQLSGGQRQRVALARALVNRPKVLLLDEPLGALDLKLRQQMQVELKELQRVVGITFVFVTHDQEEALVMSDRIAVFNRGRIEQVGSAAEVYEHPATRFVSDFVGTSNVIEGQAAIDLIGEPGTFSIRPEKLRVDATDSSFDRSARGTIRDVEYLGALTRYVVEVKGTYIVVLEQNDDDKFADVTQRKGREVLVSWRASAVQAVS